MRASLVGDGPRSCDIQAPPTRDRLPRYVVTLAGLCYLLFSSSCVVWFMQVLDPSLQNGLFWPHWNTEGFQDVVIDRVNNELDVFWGDRGDAADLLAGVVVTKPTDERKRPAKTSFQATYSRRVLHTELNTLAQAISDIRSTAVTRTPYIVAQYCWVDMDRRWDVAHTLARSKRCLHRYVDNAAVYMETILRNTNWIEWVTFYGVEWTTAVGDHLTTTTDGQQWLRDRPQAALQLDIAGEVRYLQGKNLTRYALQWHNQALPGLEESVRLVNALGFGQSVTIKSSPMEPMVWTSLVLYTNLANDLNFMRQLNASLVRGSSRHFERWRGNYSMFYGQNDRKGASDVFFRRIGPFGSVDATFVAVPPSLLQGYSDFMSVVDRHFWTTLASRDSADATTFHPEPPNFVREPYDFFGGNVLCLDMASTAFPQAPLSFYDGCSQPAEFRIVAQVRGMLLALFALSLDQLPDQTTEFKAICSYQADRARCVETMLSLTALLAAMPGLPPREAIASSAIPPVVFVQYAQDVAKTWVLLEQPLVTTNSTWSFFGWIALIDWIEGSREVVRLDGDASSIVLMSDAYPKLSPSTHTSDNVQNGTRIIFYLVVYTSAVSVAVGVMVGLAVAANRLSVTGVNLFCFNRVASPVWIGRPLLLLRGLAAVLVLSTSQVSLVHGGGLIKLENTPRSILSTLVVVGEATWLSYVLHDIFVVVATDLSARTAQLSAALAFAMTTWLELQFPVQLLSRFHRECNVAGTDAYVKCRSGVLTVGSQLRLVELLAIQAGSFVVAYVGLRLLRPIRHVRQTAPLVMHGAAALHLHPSNGRDGATWHLDDAACIMCGLIPLVFQSRAYLLDIKLWELLPNDQRAKQRLRLSFFACVSSAATIRQNLKGLAATRAVDLWWHRLTGAVGFTYILLSVAGSVSYIALTEVNLANDIYWATFNLTGHHTAVANILSRQMALGRSLVQVSLNEPRFTVVGMRYGQDPTSQVESPPFLPTRLQFEAVNSITAAIQGLRSTPPCDLPWVFSQYCWVDFNRSWELAHTAARQQRCLQRDVTNGAVFIESMLRNTDLTTWAHCWGDAFRVAIGSELERTSSGQRWLAAARADMLVLDDEVAYWTDVAGLAHYTVQWQNYKTIGLHNTYAIENAFGVSYTMSLTHSNGSYRYADQTTMKMYWGLATDLNQVASNDTAVGGLSLIRSSPQFAFANVSHAMVVVQSGVVAYPFYEAFLLVEATLGPFGSVDMRNVACPASVKRMVAHGLDVVKTLVAQNPAMALRFQSTLTPTGGYINALPGPFQRIATKFVLGGNLLCQTAARGNYLYRGLTQMTGRNARCGEIYQSNFSPGKDMILLAAMATGLAASTPLDSNVRAVCSHVQNANECTRELLGPAVAYLHVANASQLDNLAILEELADEAMMDVVQLRVALLQFVQSPTFDPLEIATYNVFEPANASFHLWSWIYVIQWALAQREVVEFEGDTGALSIITEMAQSVLHSVDNADIPTAVARYAQRGVQYVTGMLLAISTVAAGYIGLSRGRFEGQNMLELNRVAGLVWVGRPFLCLRGITALTLLSTDTLELQSQGNLFVTRFVSPDLAWYKTILSASEATWLAYILNDIFMVATKQYTRHYASASSVLLSTGVALVTIVSPTRHSVTLNPECHIDQMEFQLECRAGVVVLGYATRMVRILLAIVTINLVCFLVARRVQPRRSETVKSSLLLSSAAKYLFERSHWTHDGIYYMDPASAWLSGLASLRWKGAIYVMDVKLWRAFVFDAVAADEDLPDHLLKAIPLFE